MIGPKHTPDPWAVVVTDKGFCHIVADGLVVARLDTREPYVADAAADAQLIAAAPRLAAELAAWRAWAERWGRDIETSVSVSPITHNELVERLAATNAALREAGVES